MKKSKLIPIEVLRVEDKIFGPLNFAQISLLALPLAAAVVLLFLPPVGKLPFFKMAVIISVFAISGLLAMRINERLILFWLILIGRYNCRPKAYIKKPATAHQELPAPQVQEAPMTVGHLPTVDIRQFVPAPIWQETSIPRRSLILKDRFNKEPESKRPMKYIHKSQAVADTSEQGKLKEIREDILVLSQNRCRLILKCSTINFELMSEEQQSVIFNIYQDLLNSLDAPAQVLIRIRHFNSSENFEPDSDPDGKKQRLQFEQSALIKNMMQRNKVLTRSFYLIISHEQPETDFAAAAWQLKLKAQMIEQSLLKLGIKAETLKESETLELLWGSFNPLNQAKTLKALNKNIAPQGVDWLQLVGYEKLEEGIDYLRLNDKYAQTLVIKNYPLATDANCLSELINFDSDADISYHMEPVDSLFALEQLNRKITELESVKRSQLRSGKLLTPQITDPLDSALSLRAKLLRNQEMLFQLAVYITVFAENKQDLLAISQRLKNRLAGRLFIVEAAKYQQLPAWEAGLPLGLNNLPEIKRNFDTSSLALTFPFRSLELIEPNGILYGLNKANDSLVMIDRFALPNANSVIFAQSGAGQELHYEAGAFAPLS